MATSEQAVITPAALSALIDALCSDGWDVIAPTVADGAIVPASITSLEQLPAGIGDEQSPGRYRLRERGDGMLFGYAVGPSGPKRELFPTRSTLVQIRRSKGGMTFSEPPRDATRRAFLGLRACEIAAIGIHDVVLRDGAYADADYADRRSKMLVIAVQCGDPAATCFCSSMGTGPAVERDFDLKLIELPAPHRFVVEVGSERGRALLLRVASSPSTSADVAAAARQLVEARARIQRQLDRQALQAAMPAAIQSEHPRWDEVASRCLGCGNCTMSCPTCFCTTVTDKVSLDGDAAERTRVWDSCFTVEYGYVHGGSVRPSLRARYRQWITHKLTNWQAQFGTDGCVGCGRCITWCPAAIDITEEAAALCSPPGGTDV